MKKITLLLIFASLLYSCSKPKTEPKTKIQKPVPFTPLPRTTSGFVKLSTPEGMVLLDNTGKIRTEPITFRVGNLSENRMRFMNADDLKWGYLDTTGQKIIPAQFDRARDFSDGFARVKLNGKWGFIDYSGNRVIPPQFDEVRSFVNGFAQVQRVEDEEKPAGKLEEDQDQPRKGLWGYINKTGKRVIDFKFDRVGPFSEGLAAVMKDGKVGFIDSTGKYVIEQRFTAATGSFNNGYCLVNLSSFPDPSWAFIDKRGKIISQFVYDQVHPPSEGFARVQVKNKWGFIDIQNHPVIPASFDWASDFQRGLAAVRVDSAWGYIDKSGKMVIAPRFYIAQSFENGVALATTKDLTVLIDKQANYLFQLKKNR